MRMKISLFCAGLWILALSVGFYSLVKYEVTPGAATAITNTWPADATTSRSAGRFTLVMAAHPRCPCTRASIEEVSRLLERSASPVDAHILFFKPLGADWAPTDLWHQAVAIPGVRAIWDEGGIEAARFGARTSGHVLLFNDHGTLLFSGGVTGARGHPGPSKGNLSLAAWLTPGEAADSEALVFGCPLNDPQSICTKGKKACPTAQ